MGLGLLILLIVIAAAILIWPVIQDPSSGFMLRKGNLAEVEQTRTWTKSGYDYADLTLVSSSGLRVELAVRSPSVITTPRPLVILLGGLRTGRRAVELFSESHGVVVAALSYPYYGKPRLRGMDMLTGLPDVQQALRDTPPAVMLALEYLLKQPYVNTEQVELVGVSFGAFFISVPGALESRIKRVWLVQGAADPETIFAHQFREKISSNLTRVVLAKLLVTFIGSRHLNPEQWVGRISPRPVVVINTRDDPTFPVASVEALHLALGKPHEVIWVEGEHIVPTRRDIADQLANIVLKRVAHDYQK